MSATPTTPAGPGGAYPAWDGVRRDELPLRFPFGLALIALLKGRRGFPAGEILAVALNRGAVCYIRGGVIEADERGDTSVTLWVPAFADQYSRRCASRDPPSTFRSARASGGRSRSWRSPRSAPRCPTASCTSGS